jgi:tetratricopeptide (TPR) repeat protein
MRRIWFAFVAIVLVILGSVAIAQAAGGVWERDGALIGQVVADVRAGGIKAVGPRAAALKKALAGAKTLFPGPTEADGTRYVLTDGVTETTVVLARMVRGKKGDVTALANPYPIIALILGSYYVETRKFSDAVKALDAGLALSPLPKDRLGATVPKLLSERGIALSQLKRWKEALASYDAALAIKSVDKPVRGMLHRGRGFVLIEMGRLVDAEAAYKSSLKFDPGNAIAANELAYIKGLKAGGKSLAPVVGIPGAKGN